MPQRRPKGVYVRDTFDWFTQRGGMVSAAWGQNNASPSQDLDIAFDFYNDANDGSLMHVWRLWFFNDLEGAYRFDPYFGHGGNFLGNARPIVVNNPTPPVKVYYDTVAAENWGSYILPNPLPEIGYFIAGNESGTDAIPTTPGPVAVIPPGYSLRAKTYISSQYYVRQLAVACYFVMLPDAGAS